MTNAITLPAAFACTSHSDPIFCHLINHCQLRAVSLFTLAT